MPVSASAPPLAVDRTSQSADDRALYTVSVRNLCEFTAKRADLDRRFTPSATALEGITAEQTVATRRGQDYETQVVLVGLEGDLRVRGRADGFDPRRQCLEEVKTIRGRPDDIPENRRQLHWAQLQTYGALFCRARNLSQLELALVYFDVESQTETVLREVFGAQELEEAFTARCASFAAWAGQERAHRLARDAALRGLAFPPGEFRPGQRSLAEAVYRTAASGRCLLAQAPTGIGKTLGTLFPVLRAMPGSSDKIAYLTCKGTGRLTALQALESLRAGAPGKALRVLALVPKEQACEHPDKACHGESCPLARGFHDRLPAARQQAVDEGWMDAKAQRRIALQHGLCPYYLGQELLRWADVLVGDVHHAFDPQGQLWGLSQALDWRLAVLVDEAHNLVDRTRRMYSAALPLAAVRAAQRLAPAGLMPAFDHLLQATADLAAEQDTDLAVLDEVPDTLALPLRALAADLSEHFQKQATATGPLLDFHFELQRFVWLAELLAEHTLFDIERGHDDTTGTTGTTVSLRNVVPARFLRPRFAALHSVTLFSATLGPPAYATDLLGLPENTIWIDVPPVFAPENLTVRVAMRISTRYGDRARSLPALAAVIARQFDAQPGNYLAFFSSFDYLQQAAERLARQRPDIPQWCQDRSMPADARQAFLQRFEAGGRGVGFAVLGGVFAEGVDLPGSRLIGAFIATLGLPPVSPLQDAWAARLERIFGAGSGYADRVPAMQKVVQAAGRVLRTPEDRGWLWLLDDRYAQPAVVRLLPAWWRLPASSGYDGAVALAAERP